MKRSHNCTEVREHLINQRVSLCGWVNKRRDHGGVIFIDLRDRTGLVQVVFSPERHVEVHKQAHALRGEFVLFVEGEVAPRPKETENPNLATGMIEVNVDHLEILNPSQPIPFQLDEDVNENIRLVHRFLDLRRPEMQHNLITRHKISHSVRNVLNDNGFLDIETPMLNRSTPEGARDYLVPSRVNPGTFYALPQSPQLFKQLLMISGFDRYFQITRCFRDEDLRADRQPEFTQIDLEMSFVEPDDVMGITEKMMSTVFKEVLDIEVPLPMPRITYEEAMNRYGLDAPDVRIQLELVDLTEHMKNTGFKVFSRFAQMDDPIGERGAVKVMRVPGGASLTRKLIDGYTNFVGIYGAKGLAYIKINGPWQEDKWQSPIVKFFTDEEKATIESLSKAETGDILFFGADLENVVNEALGRLRVKVGREMNLVDDRAFSFVWVTDFPLLDWDKDAKRYTAIHHPFTMPNIEDLDKVNTLSDEAKALREQGRPYLPAIRSRAYDLVLNGVEVGGGSIRIHNPELQQTMFNLLGIGAEEADEKFGFLVNALTFGAPPHGGLALGLDRLVALMLGLDSIRDVIAFPKTQKATCAMTQAPSKVDATQLRELYLRSTFKPKVEEAEHSSE
ncbi:MAG: aspartate--tRNA ligase [Magnetococcales bacterium]|nr:aspartate--tRNA ligase [Magnetococcales bacterium]